MGGSYLGRSGHPTVRRRPGTPEAVVRGRFYALGQQHDAVARDLWPVPRTTEHEPRFTGLRESLFTPCRRGPTMEW